MREPKGPIITLTQEDVNRCSRFLMERDRARIESGSDRWKPWTKGGVPEEVKTKRRLNSVMAELAFSRATGIPMDWSIGKAVREDFKGVLHRRPKDILAQDLQWRSGRVYSIDIKAGDYPDTPLKVEKRKAEIRRRCAVYFLVVPHDERRFEIVGWTSGVDVFSRDLTSGNYGKESDYFKVGQTYLEPFGEGDWGPAEEVK